MPLYYWDGDIHWVRFWKLGIALAGNRRGFCVAYLGRPPGKGMPALAIRFWPPRVAIDNFEGKV